MEHRAQGKYRGQRGRETDSVMHIYSNVTQPIIEDEGDLDQMAEDHLSLYECVRKAYTSVYSVFRYQMFQRKQTVL